MAALGRAGLLPVDLDADVDDDKEPRLPLRSAGADAEGAQALMAKLGDVVSGFAAQNVHDVACAKADATVLLHPVDGAEQLARRVGAVPHLGW